MKRKNFFLFFLFLIGFAASYIILTLDILEDKSPPPVYEVSVITRGRNNDSWESMKHGAEQASEELFVDLSFITLSEDSGLDEQTYLLERESLGGADAIVISAADSQLLAPYVSQVAENIPVVSIDSPTESSAVFSYISADDYEMGKLLGSEIISSGNSHKRVAIIVSSLSCSNVKRRLDGLQDSLGLPGDIDLYWYPPETPEEASAYLSARLEKRSADVLIALDLTALELAGQALVDNSQQSINLFGFGATGKIASFIESGIIEATIVKNDFAIGYLGIAAAAAALSERPASSNTVVEHRLINMKNMYDTENQRLLFPSIR